MSIIDVKNLYFKYDNNSPFVLKNISFSIEKGDFVSFIGHNGSGKSTLAKLLNALLLPVSGKVLVDGMDTANKENTFKIRKKVGVIFQNPDNQIVASIVEDDIAFGPENLGIEREEIKERIDFALSAVEMQEYKDKSPMKLSGGQKQRVAIAGVLAVKPDVIILDESTAMLDPKGREEVLKVIKKLNEENDITVIQITHYMEEVVNSNKVYLLSKGEIIKSGTPKEVFSDEQKIKMAGLDYPIATKIALALNNKGLNITNQVIDKDELLTEICKLK